jgi:hypothetical protein
MADCGCARAAGCGGRKGEQAELIARTIERMYPTRRWGVLADAERFRAGVPAALTRAIARAASESLQARTFFCEGGEDELCDYVYVLCVGREPCLYELRARGGAPEADKIEEKYLRLACSHLFRAATVQEVAFTLRQRDGVVELREATRDGVYDPVLLRRLQKLVDVVAESGLRYLDFGMLCEDAPQEPVIDFGDYAEQYGTAPSALALLFSPRPAISTATVLLP